MKLRTETIEGKKIYIVDEVLEKDEIMAFYEYVSSLAFVKKEKSTSYDEFPIFSVDFEPSLFDKETFIGKKARELMSEFVTNFDLYRLFRVYVNLSNYGDIEYPHYDCPRDREDITILYYVNSDWHYKYGGETLFYSEKDTRLAVLPKPGRFVIFPGNIEHKGSIATRICKEPRLSLALKFIKNEN